MGDPKKSLFFDVDSDGRRSADRRKENVRGKSDLTIQYPQTMKKHDLSSFGSSSKSGSCASKSISDYLKNAQHDINLSKLSAGRKKVGEVNFPDLSDFKLFQSNMTSFRKVENVESRISSHLSIFHDKKFSAMSNRGELYLDRVSKARSTIHLKNGGIGEKTGSSKYGRVGMPKFQTSLKQRKDSLFGEISTLFKDIETLSIAGVQEDGITSAFGKHNRPSIKFARSNPRIPSGYGLVDYTNRKITAQQIYGPPTMAEATRQSLKLWDAYTGAGRHMPDGGFDPSALNLNARSSLGSLNWITPSGENSFINVNNSTDSAGSDKWKHLQELFHEGMFSQSDIGRLADFPGKVFGGTIAKRFIGPQLPGQKPQSLKDILTSDFASKFQFDANKLKDFKPTKKSFDDFKKNFAGSSMSVQNGLQDMMNADVFKKHIEKLKPLSTPHKKTENFVSSQNVSQLKFPYRDPLGKGFRSSSAAGPSSHDLFAGGENGLGLNYILGFNITGSPIKAIPKTSKKETNNISTRFESGLPKGVRHPSRGGAKKHPVKLPDFDVSDLLRSSMKKPKSFSSPTFDNIVITATKSTRPSGYPKKASQYSTGFKTGPHVAKATSEGRDAKFGKRKIQYSLSNSELLSEFNNNAIFNRRSSTQKLLQETDLSNIFGDENFPFPLNNFNKSPRFPKGGKGGDYGKHLQKKIKTFSENNGKHALKSHKKISSYSFNDFKKDFNSDFIGLSSAIPQYSHRYSINSRGGMGSGMKKNYFRNYNPSNLNIPPAKILSSSSNYSGSRKIPSKGKGAGAGKGGRVTSLNKAPYPSDIYNEDLHKLHTLKRRVYGADGMTYGPATKDTVKRRDQWSDVDNYRFNLTEMFNFNTDPLFSSDYLTPYQNRGSLNSRAMKSSRGSTGNMKGYVGNIHSLDQTQPFGKDMMLQTRGWRNRENKITDNLNSMFNFAVPGFVDKEKEKKKFNSAFAKDLNARKPYQHDRRHNFHALPADVRESVEKLKRGQGHSSSKHLGKPVFGPQEDPNKISSAMNIIGFPPANMNVQIKPRPISKDLFASSKVLTQRTSKSGAAMDLDKLLSDMNLASFNSTAANSGFKPNLHKRYNYSDPQYTRNPVKPRMGRPLSLVEFARLPDQFPRQQFGEFGPLTKEQSLWKENSGNRYRKSNVVAGIPKFGPQNRPYGPETYSKFSKRSDLGVLSPLKLFRDSELEKLVAESQDWRSWYTRNIKLGPDFIIKNYHFEMDSRWLEKKISKKKLAQHKLKKEKIQSVGEKKKISTFGPENAPNRFHAHTLPKNFRLIDIEDIDSITQTIRTKKATGNFEMPSPVNLGERMKKKQDVDGLQILNKAASAKKKKPVVYGPETRPNEVKKPYVYVPIPEDLLGNPIVKKGPKANKAEKPKTKVHIPSGSRPLPKVKLPTVMDIPKEQSQHLKASRGPSAKPNIDERVFSKDPKKIQEFKNETKRN